MSPPDEPVELDVRLDEEPLDDVDRFRRHTAHGSRSEVVAAAIDRLVEGRCSPLLRPRWSLVEVVRRPRCPLG